ncbi:sensor domain-containing diguanylate cyclase [Paenibacillus sp. DMB20]|uniref:sensor domain-containing diguanylate cyclase n=1 Tax=Paenibacillus sp. DMB20 TaxID=1642570 RepID=UPI003FA5BF00
MSEPYVASTGRLILLISAPIFGKDGQYKGMAGGTIYLQEDNVLSRLLGEHFYGNGSYVYVVDQHGHLIFHPDSRRINEKVGSNEVVRNAIDGGSGSAEIVNSRGVSFFAGYAYEPRGQWGIISQTPVSVLDKPLEKLALNMALQALPVFAVILLAAWRVSRYISSPLYELARFSEEAVLSKKPLPPEVPKIASLIYEVKQLHQSIGNHLSLLNDEIQIDGLTGLANRKTFDLTLQEWLEERVPFALILLDIDFFKRVNDLHGHAAGDEVLRHLATRMRLGARQEDLCFRYGGEEFGILVKHGGLAEATEEAEKLRHAISSEPGPYGITITVSLGIAVYMPHERLSPKELVERADSALYRSKVEGRNRVTAFTSPK